MPSTIDTVLKTCKECNKPHNKKSYCSKDCYYKSMKGVKNEKAHNWRGNNVSVNGVHVWLNANYGKPQACEFCNVEGSARTIYDWALKKGCVYEKNRDSFLRLCRKCHQRYDGVVERFKKIGAANKGKYYREKLKANQFSKKGKLLKTWNSVLEASEGTKLTKVAIYAALKGTNKTCGGYRWEYQR